MRVGSLEIQIMAGLARLQKDMNDAQRIVGGSMANVEKSVASAKRAMQTLGVGLSIIGIIDQVRRMTDQYTKLDAQLRLSTKTQAQYAQGMSDIRRISSIAQADISATSMLYTRLMNVMQGTGVEQSKLATVTETVSFGLKAYGATAQEASSAALQLSQAMGANRLGGEEFRAVMEAMPNVMKVVADSMSKSEGRQILLGDLRQLSIDGKITADVLVNALGDPAIAAQFKALAENTQTVTGAWVVARNELMLLVGEFGKSSGGVNIFIGAFKAMGETFALLAKHMQSLIFIAGGYVAFLVTKMVVGTVLAIEKSIAHTEALAMNAAGTRAHAAVLVQAAAAETAAASAAAAAKLAETVATREALFAAEAELVAKVASTRATIAQAEATSVATVGIIQANRAKAAATVATTELAIAEAALAKINKARNADQVTAIAMDAVRTRELKAAAEANAALAAAEAARAKSALGWIAAIVAGLRAAAMAHPITAAVVAISAIVVAIANWKDIVNGSKASFSWFMDEFIGGIRFLAEGVGISLGELVQKMSLLANLTWPDLKSGEFKKQWDKLGELAEQSRVEAAAKLRGIDKESLDREKLAAALQLAADREEWDKLTNTKAQQRQAEIAALNEHYLKIITGRTLSQAQHLVEAERYHVALKNIDDKYSREAVKAAGNAHTSKMEQTLAALQAEAAAEEGKLSRVQKVSLEYQALKVKEQTLAEYGVFVLALEQAALLDERDAQEALNKQLASGTEAYNDFWAGVEQSTEKLVEQAKQQEFENTLIGKTKTEIAALTKLREAETIAKEEANLAAMKLNGAYAEEILKQQALIDAMKRKRDADNAKTDIEAAQAVADAQLKAAEEQWKMIDGFAHTAFDNILDKGKNVFAEIGNAIKKYVLDMLYKMTVQKWLINVGILGGGTGAAGSAMAGGMGTAAGIGASIMGQSAAFMGGISGAMSMGVVDGFMAGVPLLTSGLTGGISAGLGLMMPAIGLVGAGIALLSKWLGGNGGTPGTNVGAASTTFSPTGAITGQGSWAGLSPATNQAGVQSFVTMMNTSYRTAAQSLGITAASTIFSLSQNLGKDSKAPQFAIRGGAAGSSEFFSGWTPQSDAAMQLAASRAVMSALQGSELPGYLQKVFSGLKIETMSQTDIDNTLAFASSLKTMRDVLTETRSPLEVMTATMNTGFAQLNTSAATFKTDFVAAIDAGLTPEQFQSWVSLGGVIDTVAQSTRDLAAAMKGADEAIASSLDKLLGVSTFSQAQAVASQGSALAEITKLLPTVTTFDQVMKIATGDMSGLTLAQKQAIATYLGLTVTVNGFNATVTSSTKVVELNSRMMDHLAKRAQSFGERLDAIGQGPGQKLTTTYADELVAKTLGNIAGVYGDTGSVAQVAAQRKALEDLIAAKELALVEQRKKESLGGTWSGTGTVKALLDQIAAAQKALGDITKLQGFEKLAPGHGKELLALEQWYADQKKIVGKNQELLLVLEKTYGDKRKAILEASVADMLNAWKGIQDFVKSLDTSTKYGATPQAAMEAARAQYIADMVLAKGGDIAAMGRVTADAQKYIELSQAMYGSGGPMSAIIAQIKAELLGLDPAKKKAASVGIPDLYTKTSESVSELQGVRQELKDTKAVLARLLEQVNKAVKEQTMKLGEAVSQGANKQATATTNAAVLSKVN